MTVGFDRIPGGWFFYIGPFSVGWECRVRRVKPCQWCEGTGLNDSPAGGETECAFCDGTGVEKEDNRV